MFVDSFFVFFFKQKTAYEMRISDWSSDVCSRLLPQAGHSLKGLRQDVFARDGPGKTGGKPPGLDSAEEKGRPPMAEAATQTAPKESFAALLDESLGTERSEEHTSELQSLMRISYAVFCLKKQTINE